MKRWKIAFAALMIAATGCRAGGPEENEKISEQRSAWTESQTSRKAGKAAGFDDFRVPEKLSFFKAEGIRYRGMPRAAEAVYTDRLDRRITIRKSSGLGGISGDYTDYEEKTTVKFNGIPLSCGGRDGKIFVAQYLINGKIRYTIASDTGMDEDQLKEIFRQVY